MWGLDSSVFFMPYSFLGFITEYVFTYSYFCMEGHVILLITSFRSVIISSGFPLNSSVIWTLFVFSYLYSETRFFQWEGERDPHRLCHSIFVGVLPSFLKYIFKFSISVFISHSWMRISRFHEWFCLNFDHSPSSPWISENTMTPSNSVCVCAHMHMCMYWNLEIFKDK